VNKEGELRQLFSTRSLLYFIVSSQLNVLFLIVSWRC
jgi:hypothetical protein